jgi:UDP-glucose 4-epimerase
MRILITGGAGFIGSNIANTLSEDNNDTKVIALDNLSLGQTSNLSSKVKFVEGSIMDYKLMLKVTKGCDYVFHHAAKSSSPMFTPDPRQGIDTNLMGFMNVMEASKRNKVKKVIFSSSSSVYNGLAVPFKESCRIVPKTFYECSFYCREILAHSYYLESGLKSIGLRYFSVYGPNEIHKGRFANNISQFIWDMSRAKSPIIYGDGSQTRDFTFIKDVVKSNILAMNAEEIECGVYNVGTGIKTSFNRLINIINENLGTNLSPTYVDNPIINYVHDTQADISLIRSNLKYKPTHSIEEGIRKMVGLYLQEGIEKRLMLINI